MLTEEIVARYYIAILGLTVVKRFMGLQLNHKVSHEFE